MMIGLKSTNVLIVALLCLTALTVLFRQSMHNDNTIYKNYDATYHVLLTIEALKQTPVAQHHLLPIVSLGDDSDKHIPWGATVPDKHGNYYYTSFPLGGFIFPYFAFNTFNLDATVDNLFLFSSLILACSAILFFLLTRAIAIQISTNGDPGIPAFMAGLVYLFSMETLYSHGYIYWGHSLMQPIYLGFLYIIFKILTKQERAHSTYALFFLSFFLGSIEWSGYLVVFGTMVAIALSKIPRNKKYYHVLACATGAVLALSVFVCVFLFTVDSGEFFSALAKRFVARNISNDISLVLLFLGYWESYSFFLVLLPLSLIIFYLRKDIEFEKKYAVSLLFLIMTFGLIENFIMKQHAISYHFDRLKLLPFFSLAIPIAWMPGRYYQKLLVFFVIAATSIYSLFQYPKYRMKEDVALTQNINFIKQGDFNRECSPCIAGVGVSVRGYTNLLFGRGVYERQTTESLNALAEKMGKCACYVDVEFLGGGGMIKIDGFKKYD